MKKNKNKGFTLIELLVVVAIIGILASVGVVAYGGYTASAKKGAAKSNFNSVAKWTRNELQKCNIGEAKAMDDKLTCTDTNNATKVALAVFQSQTSTTAKMKNPYGGANAVVNTAVAATCTTTNRGQIGVAASGTDVKVTACTAAADGTVTNFYSEVIALD
jgi:type IV pilus assembly protein PilA